MKIHEHQGKDILKQFGVPVPQGYVAYSVEEAVEAAKKLPTQIAVVKAQIHAGGRGLGGGVKIAKNIDEVRMYAEQILGMQLVTHQTGPAGQKVKRLLIEQGINIAKEFYAGIVLDRSTGQNVVMVSTEGGMEIEKVAEESPEKILKAYIDPAVGFRDFQARELAFGLGLSGESLKQCVK